MAKIFMRLNMNRRFVEAAINYLGPNFVKNLDVQFVIDKMFDESVLIPRQKYREIAGHSFIETHYYFMVQYIN